MKPPAPKTAAPKKHRVTRGNSHLSVYKWVHPRSGAKRWRFAYQLDGTWKYKTFKTLADAEHAAGKILEEVPAGLAWTALDENARKFLEEVHRRTPPTDRPSVIAFLRSRDSSAEVSAAVASFTAHKKSEAGEQTPHLRQVFKVLENLARHFSGRRVSEIHPPELAEWWELRGEGLSAKTRRDLRAHLVTFWRWCLRQGIAGADPITAAERLPTVKLSIGEKRVLTAAEVCAILNAIPRQWRAWVVLGAFAGLRPEEIVPARNKKAHKRGLLCEEIDWEFSVIRLPACVSKVNRGRIVPMSDALKAALRWADIQKGMTGKICLTNPANTGDLARLGNELFSGHWPQDALRHSFGSYRNAILRNLSQVAEEMGTSVQMLERHYHNPQPTDLGTEWFALRPAREIGKTPFASSGFDGDPTEWRFNIYQPVAAEQQTLDKSTKTA